MIGQHETITIKLSRLEQLEQDSKDLKRARALISRVRAENKVLKEEKARIFSVLDKIKSSPTAGTFKRRLAVVLTKITIQKARLI